MMKDREGHGTGGLVTEVTSSHETCSYGNKRPNHFAAKLLSFVLADIART